MGVAAYLLPPSSLTMLFILIPCRIAQLELQRLGLDTQYHPLPIDAQASEIWEGVKNRYWHFTTYFLPVCTLTPSEGDTGGKAQAEEGAA